MQMPCGRPPRAAGRRPGRSRGASDAQALRPCLRAAAGRPGADITSSSTQHQSTARAPPHYSHLPFDRAAAAALRKDAPSLAAARADPAARAVAVTPRGEALVTTTADGRIEPAFLPLAALAAPTSDEPPILLGREAGTGAPVFAVVLPRPAADLVGAPLGAEWQSVVSTAGPAADGPAAAVLALAVGLGAFAATARFDAGTGAPLVAVEGGHARRPEGSGKIRSTRPRVDPAVLALTTAGPGGAWALLGRKPTWPPRRYSLLAGFVELGETLEQAAGREVAEEAGVAVDGGSIKYVASQPWPFPQSLMVAFTADAAVGGGGGGGGGPGAPTHPEDEDLPSPAAVRAAAVARSTAAAQATLPPAAPLDGELADVRWFHAAAVRDAIAAAAAGGPPAPCGLAVPGRHALAHSVLGEWSGRVLAAEEGPLLLAVVHGEAVAGGGPTRRSAVLLVVEAPAQAPYLVVRAAASDDGDVVVAAVEEARAVGATATPLARGWLALGGAPGSDDQPVRRLGVGGERAALVADVLRVALPLHEVVVVEEE